MNQTTYINVDYILINQGRRWLIIWNMSGMIIWQVFSDSVKKVSWSYAISNKWSLQLYASQNLASAKLFKMMEIQATDIWQCLITFKPSEFCGLISIQVPLWKPNIRNIPSLGTLLILVSGADHKKCFDIMWMCH